MAAEAALDQAATDFIAQGVLLGDPRDSEGGFAFWPTMDGDVMVYEPIDLEGHHNKITPGLEWIGGVAVSAGTEPTNREEIRIVHDKIYSAAITNMFARLRGGIPQEDTNG